MIIGFGMKTDLATGQTFDLDKTFTDLIKPAFDRADINCFRAIDINRTGSIDKIMYRWIYEADMVVADLSTLNANVFYELGVRHTLKPKTTIIISEQELLSRLPFDLSHTIVHKYEHLGEKIADDEKERFVQHLSEMAVSLRDKPEESDSPVYTYLEGMTPPLYKNPVERIAELEEELRKALSDSGEEDKSISALVNAAEEAKNNKDYDTAIFCLETAHELEPQDTFIIQRLCLATYKSESPDKIAALEKAEEILQKANPEHTTDPETLGLAGAIYKRYHEAKGDIKYLDKSMWYYGRGFYVKQDYYNGINLAYLHTIKSTLMNDDFESITHYGQGNEIRKKVADICKGLIDSTNFGARGDKQWVYMTLAEAYVGLGQESEAESLFPKIATLSKGDFDMSTFKNQNQKLVAAMETFNNRFGNGIPTVKVDTTTNDDDSAPESTVKNIKPTVSKALGKPIIITIDDTENKPVKAVEVNCKIEFK